MLGLSEFGLVTLVATWAVCVGLGMVSITVAKKSIWSQALITIVLAAVTTFAAMWVANCDDCYGEILYRPYLYWPYLAAPIVGVTLAATPLLTHKRSPPSKALRLLLRWGVTPMLLASIFWLAVAAFSPSWPWGVVDERTMGIVTLAIPAGTLAAYRYEHLTKPGPLDHLRQAGLLYASWVFPGDNPNYLSVQTDPPLIFASLAFLLAIVLNAAVHVVWRVLRLESHLHLRLFLAVILASICSAATFLVALVLRSAADGLFTNPADALAALADLWIQVMIPVLPVALLVVAASGLPLFYLLLWKRRSAGWPFVAAGAVEGAAITPFLTTGLGDGFQATMALIGVLVGSVTGCTFWLLVRGALGALKPRERY